MTGFVHNIRLAARLSWRDKVQLARALVLIPVFAVAKRRVDYEHAMASGSMGHDATPAEELRARELARLVDGAARCYAGQPNCLTRSLTLLHLLDGEGIVGTLRMGAALDGSILSAHAWVECKGRPINDSKDVAQRFAPFEHHANASPRPSEPVQAPAQQ